MANHFMRILLQKHPYLEVETKWDVVPILDHKNLENLVDYMEHIFTHHVSGTDEEDESATTFSDDEDASDSTSSDDEDA